MSSDGTREPRNWKVKKKDGSRLEPASLAILRQWVASQQIEPDDLIINDDLADWIRAAEVLELFDLFEQRQPLQPQTPPEEAQQPPQLEIEIPGCAFHPDRTAKEICVGCGKFVCTECCERIENKVYCRACAAEKQVGAEPGGPAGPGAVARIIPGTKAADTLKRSSLASLVFAALALASSLLLIRADWRLYAAPAVGCLSFFAALFGTVCLFNPRQSSPRSRQFGLIGLIAGLCLLIVSIATISSSMKRLSATSGERAAVRNQPGSLAPQTGRRQIGPLTEQAKDEREADARRLLDQTAEYLKNGQLEQAVASARTLMGLYPDTDTAKLLEQRLPVLEQALGEKQAQEKATVRQDEELARQRLEQAAKVYAEGNHATAVDLLTSIIENYPDTEAAAAAQKELTQIQALDTALVVKRQDQEASELVQRAREHMKAEQYKEAVELYQQVIEQYPKTPTALSVRSEYEQAQLLLDDPSEREFQRILHQLADQTYESTIEQLQKFLTGNPGSPRFEDAKKMLQENQSRKREADALYTFGRAYMDESKYSLALGRYEKLIDEHPQSQWIPQARSDYEQALEKVKE